MSLSKDLTTIQPTQLYYGGDDMDKWIPVSEKLPEEEYKIYIITTKNGLASARIFVNGSNYWKENVIAWMPLPKPYKENN